MTGGLTGGIACGKSTAARFFSEEGFGTIDSDAVVHELLASDPEVIEAVGQRFGPEVTGADGRVDRRRLGGIVFAEPKALAWLEELLHPRVGEAWRAAVGEEPDRPWIVQIPLLFEKRLESSFDFTVCVGSDLKTQRRRLEGRGLSKEDVAGRIDRQLPLGRKAELADYYLHNDGTMEFLHAQVRHLAALLAVGFQTKTTKNISDAT